MRKVVQGCLQGDSWQGLGFGQLAGLGGGLVLAWAVMLLVKLGLGYALKWVAATYMNHYEELQSRNRCSLSIQNCQYNAVIQQVYWLLARHYLLYRLPMLFPHRAVHCLLMIRSATQGDELCCSHLHRLACRSECSLHVQFV